MLVCASRVTPNWRSIKRRTNANETSRSAGRRHSEVWGNGIYAGVLYGESLGTREVGVVIGYGISSTFVGR
jgi:hypothetical protein